MPTACTQATKQRSVYVTKMYFHTLCRVFADCKPAKFTVIKGKLEKVEKV